MPVDASRDHAPPPRPQIDIDPDEWWPIRLVQRASNAVRRLTGRVVAKTEEIERRMWWK